LIPFSCLAKELVHKFVEVPENMAYDQESGKFKVNFIYENENIQNSNDSGKLYMSHTCLEPS